MRLFIKNVCVKIWAFLASVLSIALIFTLSLPLSRPLVSLGAENVGTENVEKNGMELVSRREYSLFSTSSSAHFSSGETLAALPFIRGETVIFSTRNREKSKQAAQKIVSFYDAEINFTESVCGGVSYYCYSKKIGSSHSTIIGDQAVNLHVFVGDNEVRAGVPLIFGGY